MAYRKQGFADGGVLYAKNLIAMENAIIDIEELINAAGGMKGDKGEKGDPFTVAKTYSTIAEMNADFGNASIAEGSFVVIASDTEDADNAKLYIKGKTSYTFVTDMSGVQGFKGEPGITPHIGDNGHWWIGDYDTGVSAGGNGDGGAGIVSIKRTYGDGSPGTTDIYTITLTDGTSYGITVYNGKDGLTPYIGDNGNWWIGDTDTGVSASGGTFGGGGGSDHSIPVAFTATLAASDWAGNTQTITDSRLLADGYSYLVTPASDTLMDYATAFVYASDVVTDGKMVFNCMTAPSVDLAVNIVRMGVEEA